MQFKKVSVLLISSCGGFFASACSGPEAENPVIDPVALRDELLQADKDFSKLAFDQGVARAYEQFVASDAVQLPDGGMPLSGKQAILDNVEASVGDIEFSLSWEPVDALVSASGDIGYTWGFYYLETLDDNGELYTAEGKYANVWQNSAADGWQVILDVSNQNEPPFPVELEFDGLLEEAGVGSP
jgi:ketosteroid isomerase-like protein